MCGRVFTITTYEELFFRHLKGMLPVTQSVTDLAQLNPNYNMCPTQSTLILCRADDLLTFKSMRWGLVPAWAKTVKDADKYSMINAKSEEITEKKSYKAAFQKRRCIVPVSGFFEWRTEDKVKIPFAITLKDKAIMSLAGVWEHWQSPESSESVDSFSIVTTAANSFMAKIHTRMPVILSEDQEVKWLDSGTTVSELNEIMKSDKAKDLEMRQVSKRVNSPENNSPEVLDATS
jgi:putative SOS response-associated peptidase YedK